MDTTVGVLTVMVKHRCLIEVLRGRVRLVRCYLQYIHASQNPRSAFRLRRLAKSAWRARVLSLCAFMVAFSARRKGNLMLWRSTVEFRDRRKGSDRLCFEVQISWQPLHFGHRGGLRRSDIVTGAVNQSKRKGSAQKGFCKHLFY